MKRKTRHQKIKLGLKRDIQKIRKMLEKDTWKEPEIIKENAWARPKGALFIVDYAPSEYRIMARFSLNIRLVELEKELKLHKKGRARRL